MFENHHGQHKSMQNEREMEEQEQQEWTDEKQPTETATSFGPIKQKTFTPGPELEANANIARALGQKSPKRYYQVQRSTKQV